MLLQELCALAQCDADQPPPMYQKATIRYLISLRADGSMVGNLRDVSTATQDNTKRGISVFAPHVKRSSGIRPKLLADFSPYVLGIVLDNSKQARAEQQHAQFVELVNRCRDATQEPSVAAISTFLATFDPESLKSDLPKGFDPSGTITFEVGQERLRPIDLPSVRQFWATYTGVDDTDPSVPLFSCIVCNEERPALERHPIRIKGVPGGEKLKDLVSANRPAFLSYGLKASQVAPTCQSCAEAYANALNSLLADKRTSLQTNDGAYAFWTRADAEFAVSPLIVNPDEQQIKVKLLMESWKRGDVAALDFDLTPFYAVGLSGSGARLVINDWIDTSIGQAEHLLGRYFALQELVGRDGEPGAFLSINRLTNATIRDPKKDKAPAIVRQSLVRLALLGYPLPMDLLYLAVRRNRATQGVTRDRAMLIKMTLLSHTIGLEGTKVPLTELEPGNSNQAYLCGRLLAVLNDVQYYAFQPNPPNATIVDRYYGAASSTPGVVLGMLVRNAQPHLAKLRRKGRSERAAAVALDQRILELMDLIQDPPTTLNLQQQGWFALGFYHQRAETQRAARAAARAKVEASERTSSEA